MVESKNAAGTCNSAKTNLPYTVDMKGLYETWEKATGAWFEAWSKSPAFLAAMGQTLEAQLGTKNQFNKAFETVLETWKVPTAKDVEAISDRISHIEERLANIEEAVGAPVGAGTAHKS